MCRLTTKAIDETGQACLCDGSIAGQHARDRRRTINVTPPVSSWLGEEEFCAYSFELSVQDRTTNGKTAASAHEVHDEVVGMRWPDGM